MPTTFIYGFQDWMNYEAAMEARKQMKVPCEIIRVPQVSLSPPLLVCLVAFACERIHSLICVYIFKNIYLNLERILFLFKCRLDTLCS